MAQGAADRGYKHAGPKPKEAGKLAGREIAKEAARMSIVGRKHSPERMALFLRKLLEFPNVSKACLFAGFTYPTLRYWIASSERGHPGDGYDLTFGEDAKRFHEHYADCLDAAVQMVEDAYIERAIHGYYEVLSDKGRVIYQIDPVLDALGMRGTEAYLLDSDGRPIPERIQHQDPEVMLAVLKAWRRDRYGAKAELDVNHRGGVLVVGVRAKNADEIEQREREYLKQPIDVPFEEVPDDK